VVDAGEEEKGGMMDWLAGEDISEEVER